jgi:hypothetical protein
MLAASVASAADDSKAPAPTADRLPELTSSLAERLRGKTVRMPAGGEVAIVATGDESPAVDAVLTVPRLRTSLETVGEAGGWPSAWLVIQDAARDFDVVMHLRLGADGEIATPETIFAAARREWDDATLEAAVREATGRKAPKERERSLVIQSFTKKTVTSFVYETPKAGKGEKGLLPLLPEGSLIREARNVDLGDGLRHTLALVLVRPTFIPSDCSSCKDRLYGHADTGQVLLVLAGERALDDTLDLTAKLQGSGKEALVPRYACTEEDATSRSRHDDVARFKERETVKLLELEDYDGDGSALEVAFDGEFNDCNRHASVVAGIAPGSNRLRLYLPSK